LEATVGGTLVVDDSVSGAGTVTISGGGIADFLGSFNENVTFSGAGTLELSSGYTGKISGLSGTSDILDLDGFNAAPTDAFTATSHSYNSVTNITTLIVTDTTTHVSETIKLVGNYSTAATTWTATNDGHGGVDVYDPPAVTIAGGSALEIAGATDSAENVTFLASTGFLTLDTPSSFTGLISGFTGDGTLSGSDQIDLKGINYNSASFSETYNAAADTLTVSDGTTTAVLHFVGTYVAANFSFVSDGHGGTIVYDPPVHDGKTLGAQVVHDSGPALGNNSAEGVANEAFTQAHDGGSSLDATSASGESASGALTSGYSGALGPSASVNLDVDGTRGAPLEIAGATPDGKTLGALVVHDSGPAPHSTDDALGNGYAFNFANGSGPAHVPPVPSSTPTTAGNWGADGFTFKPDLAPLMVHDFEPQGSVGANFGHAMFGSLFQVPAPLQPIVSVIDGLVAEGQNGLLPLSNAIAAHFHDFHLT
jgi:hypothetical protein